MLQQILHKIREITDEKVLEEIDGSDYWSNIQYDVEREMEDDGELSEGMTKEEREQALEAKMQEEKVEWVENRRSDFEAQFYSHAEDQEGKLVVYRAMTVPDPDVFVSLIVDGLYENEQFKGVGVYWAWDENKADSHWGRGGMKGVVLRGLVDLKDIDFETTAMMNFDPRSGEEEAEIRIREGAQIQLLGVKIENKWVEPEAIEPVYVAAQYRAIIRALLEN